MIIRLLAFCFLNDFENIIQEIPVCSLHDLLFGVSGLLFVTEGGNYVLKMVDSYASGWNVLIICLLETTVISYIYGYDRFAKVVQPLLLRHSNHMPLVTLLLIGRYISFADITLVVKPAIAC